MQSGLVAQDILCDLCCRGGGLCTCPNTVGRCRCPPNAAPSPSCVFYSPRIVSLVEGQRTEFETAQDHWTVVDAGSAAELDRVGEENRKYFDELLVKHPEWGAFFQRIKDLEAGAKIGEGGQAEIFAAASASYLERQLVVKVWKEGVSLRDLERQWPPQMLLEVSKERRNGLFRIFLEGCS